MISWNNLLFYEFNESDDARKDQKKKLEVR